MADSVAQSNHDTYRSRTGTGAGQQGRFCSGVRIWPACRHGLSLAIAAGMLAACTTAPLEMADREQANAALDALPPAYGLQPYSAHALDDAEPAPVPRLHKIDESPLPSVVHDDARDVPAYLSAFPAVTPLTLESAYLMALDNDPQLRAAYAELQASGHGVTAARAGLLPTLYLEGNYTKVDQDIVESSNEVYDHGQASWTETQYSLNLHQPVFDIGVFHKWRQAQDSERREVANYAYAQQDLMLRTATAYLGILAALDQIELTEAERAVTLKQKELAQVRYDSGQDTAVSLSEVQARLDLQQANYLLAKNALLDRQQALHEIIGFGNVELVPVRTQLDLVLPQPNDPQAWLDRALEQNWAIRAAQAAVKVAEREVMVQKAGHFPSVNLRASHGRNDTGGSLFGGGSVVDDTRITLNLHVPILEGGYTWGMSRAAASRLSATQMQLSQARRAVHRQVQSAFYNIVTGVDRIRALQSSVQAFEQAQEMQSERFAFGLTDIVSVLDATRNLYNARRQEAEARYNYVLDTLKLKQAAGTLADNDIATLSRNVLMVMQ